MGRLHYVFNERYIFDANYRIDGSTQFGSANRYGKFPGVAAKWLISDEPLFKKAFGDKVVTLLAFRPSWGISGRQPGKNYLQYSLLSTDSYGYMDMSAVYPYSYSLGWIEMGEGDLHELGCRPGTLEW